MLYSLPSVDFDKFEELEIKRGKIDLYKIIKEYKDYDRTTLRRLFYEHEKISGEHKQKIEKGLQSLYLNEDYRESMIKIAEHDGYVKELMDKFERGDNSELKF